MLKEPLVLATTLFAMADLSSARARARSAVLAAHGTNQYLTLYEGLQARRDISKSDGSSSLLHNISEVIASAAYWRDESTAAASSSLNAQHHENARKFCSERRKQTLSTGGWCLNRMVSDKLFGEERRVQTLNGGSSYRLPASHVPADKLLLLGIRTITDGLKHSVLDFGAGVGQYGRELQGEGLRWRGFDGAGDVEEYTDGFVKYADLTIPLSIQPRADWVVSFEVGEHVPRKHELMVVRNLHAHNKCGVLLSWACCHSGHQHVNLRPNALVIEWFDQLGYYYDARRTEAMRNPRLREQLRDNRTHRVYGWFATSVMLFVRRTPLRGCALVS